MQHCEHCKVDIRGERRYCPLCQNPLSGTGSREEEVFPFIPESYQYNLVLRLMLFISISTVVVSIAMNAMFPVDINWSVFVIAGILCMWISLAIVIRKRYNIPKTITWQVALISVLAVIWDWRIGWKGWSLDYVIPIACVAAMVVMAVTAKIMRLAVRNFIIYFLLDAVFGIIPVIFVKLDLLSVKYPSVICVTVSVISIAALVLFEGENMRDELNKKMHI